MAASPSVKLQTKRFSGRIFHSKVVVSINAVCLRFATKMAFCREEWHVEHVEHVVVPVEHVAAPVNKGPSPSLQRPFLLAALPHINEACMTRMSFFFTVCTSENPKELWIL